MLGSWILRGVDLRCCQGLGLQVHPGINVWVIYGVGEFGAELLQAIGMVLDPFSRSEHLQQPDDVRPIRVCRLLRGVKLVACSQLLLDAY